MYPKIKKAFFLEIDDLDVYSEEAMEKKVEDGSLNPEDEGFLRGHNQGSEYIKDITEEEEEEEE